MSQSNSILIYSAIHLILLLASLTAAANEMATEAELHDETGDALILERTSVPPQQNHMISLAAALDPNEIIWLNEGEKTFITLYRPALQAAQMAVVLMPDSIHKLAQRSLMRQLYIELPMTGWSTLHISLPKSVEKTETPNEAQEALAAERIATSIGFLLDKGVRSVALVAENHSAQRAIQASITQADATSGLVLWRVDRHGLSLPQLKALAQSQITVLDVVDHGISATEKAERVRQFNLAGFAQNYRLITSPQGSAGIDHTQRRVRDWLETRFKKF